MKYLSSFLIGLLFSSGLIVSQMINPAKVLGFLDVFGSWDPSLAFVMGGAVLVTTIGFNLIGKRQTQPVFNGTFSIPTRTDIDPSLFVGPTLFGVGWGLVGLCPGPAFAAFTASPRSIGLFLFAMLCGMYLARIRGRLRLRSHPIQEV